MRSVTQPGPIHLGLDVHKDSISVAVLPWGQDAAEVDKIFHDEPSVRRLVAPGSMIRGGCGPATRPARPVMSCSGCWRGCGCAATWWRRR